MGKSIKKILITGGAGFIGTSLTRTLLTENHEITILDNFHPQIHGSKDGLVEDLVGKVNLIIGDVTDKKILFQALEGKDVVIHFAAETGTGQSMYSFSQYSNVNIQATAFLCDYLINKKHSIKTVILASSRAIYGEGKYYSDEFGVVYPESRNLANLKNNFEVTCPISGKNNLKLMPTDELSKIQPSSFYGITKQVQEQMIILATQLKKIRSFSLRYQNVYGPGQSLKNPYTGILSIFTTLAIQNKEINIFEDGLESRDFVHIDDVVNVTKLCLKIKKNNQFILNVGSGAPTKVIDVAQEIVKYLKSNSKITISGNFREGDIRHNYADLTRLKNIINYQPKWNFTEGLQDYLNWALKQKDIKENNINYNQSLNFLKERGLMNG